MPKVRIPSESNPDILNLALVGAVEMPLYCAQIEDVDGQGRNFWLDGCPAGDPRVAAWERRRRCYDLVLDSLGFFDEAVSKAPARAPAAAPDGVHAVCNAAYELALGSEDEVFHSTLYDWLISRGLADQLLEVSVQIVI
jgi:nuclear pore complex protein Nup155